VVPVETPGVVVRDYRTIDGQRAATVQFNHVAVPASRWASWAAGRDAGRGRRLRRQPAVRGGVGAMDAIFAATLDYLKTRKQFGAGHRQLPGLAAPHGRHVHPPGAGALDGHAGGRAHVLRCRGAPPRGVGRQGAAGGRFIGQQAVQLHGGMGVTDELPAAHHFKRLSMIELTLGDVDHHLERFIAQRGSSSTPGATRRPG
jgi:alkylation response protein AidB-like acyl-CoA dehydrogenase